VVITVPRPLSSVIQCMPLGTRRRILSLHHHLPDDNSLPVQLQLVQVLWRYAVVLSCKVLTALKMSMVID
jgi:hypothetical protein